MRPCVPFQGALCVCTLRFPWFHLPLPRLIVVKLRTPCWCPCCRSWFSKKKKDLQSHPSLKPGGVWFYRVFLLYHMDFWEANWQDNHLGVSERMMRHQFKEVFLKSKTCKTVYGNLWSCIIPNIQCVWRLLKPIQPIPVTPNLPSCGQVFLDLAPGKRSLDLSLALSKRLKLNKNCGSDTPLQTYLVSV